jgi:hypothetical protein
MPAPTEESIITDSGSRVISPKVILLEIGDSLHKQSNGIYDDASNIPARPKVTLRILLNVRRIKDCHRQGNHPDPDHLKDPKCKEFEEVIPLVVESVVLSSLEDAEEEKSREPEAPDHDEQGGDNLTRIMLAAKRKSYDS